MPIDVGGWRIRNEMLIRTMVKCHYRPVANPNSFLSQGLPRCLRVDILFIAVLCLIALFFEMVIDRIKRYFIGLRRMANLHNMVTLPVFILHSLIEWSMQGCNNKKSSHLKLIVTVYSLLMASSVNSLLLLVSGIHPNPGPTFNKTVHFCCVEPR